MRLVEVVWPELGRTLYARPGTSDQRVIADAQLAQYHVPPEPINPRTVLDIGANIGATTAHYQHLWPDAIVAAAEMNLDNFRVLERNAPSVLRRCEAVSATSGVRVYRRHGDAESYRLEPDGEQAVRWNDVVVPSFTLAQTIRRCFGLDPDPVDFTKIDIEGAEWEILADAEPWAPLVRSLLVELHPAGAPEPPPEPWPEGRDGPSPLLAAAIPLLEALGFDARPHAVHPHAVWAVQR